MKVLTKLKPNEMPEKSQTITPELKSEAARSMFNRFKLEYDTRFGHGCDAPYLYEPEKGADWAGELSLIYGPEYPGSIRNHAKSWNAALDDAFSAAVEKLRKETPIKDGKPAWHEAPGQTIYAVKMAAMAIDGDLYAFADEALMVGDYGRLETSLEQQKLDEILRHPERYAILEVYPK